MIRDFDNWNLLKKKLDSAEKLQIFKEKEIWWCSLGINIGHEENGKNQLFHRPILILKKFNSHIFLGIPLTSKIKENKFYHHFSFKGKSQCAMLSQLRTWGSERLTHRIGNLTSEEFELIKRKIKEMI